MYLKPKKSLGQNFIFDKNIQDKVIKACDVSISDVIIEIGAGTGIFTKLLAQKAARIYAYELDSSLCVRLGNVLKDYPNVTLINQDFLKASLEKLLKPKSKGLKIFGNIPYYISTPILEKIFKNRTVIKTVFLTVQREFAERMCAKAGSKVYGSLSCFVQYYSQPEILFSIKKTSFYPRPSVDSCFVRLELKKKVLLRPRDEELLFKVMRSAFGQRRKMLRASLKGVISTQSLDNFFSQRNINPQARPEELSLEDFINLAFFVKPISP